MPKHPIEDMKILKEKSSPIREEFSEVKHTRNGPRYLLWLVAVFSVCVLVFALSSLFGKADVVLNPKVKQVALNENLSAKKDSNPDGLFFNLVIFPGEESKTIEATLQKDVALKATGVAVIYNAFSSAMQRLDVDTRLEGSNGKIYKTLTKTIVPGMNKDGTPGSVEVSIYGSEAGDSYNSPPLDFKIFGFKGTSKYSKFYGRSKGEITGGYEGKAPDISPADKMAAISQLKDTLEIDLLKKAAEQIPNGFILFKNATIAEIDDTNVSSVYNKDGSLTLALKGNLYGFLFSEKELTKKIVEDNIENYDGSEVYVPNIQDLNFSMSGKENILPDSLQNLDFNLSGPAKIVWKVDVDKFTGDLLGKSKKDFNQVLPKYQNIDSATLTMSPIWKTSIPDKAKDIKVIVNYPK